MPEKSNFKLSEFLHYFIPFIFLTPILLFPISNDLSIFLTAGKTIAEGGKLYVDFIDIKPPLGYYLFSGVYLVFGTSEFMLRLFDFLLQSTAIILIFIIVEKYYTEFNFEKENSIPDLKDKKVYSILAGSIYAIGYTSLAFNQTLQLESFTGLLIAILLLIQYNPRNNKLLYLLIRGVICGIAFSLKFTFGILLFAVIIDDFFRKEYRFKQKILRAIFTSTGFTIATLISFIALSDKEVYNGYLLTLKYVAFYAGYPPNDLSLIKTSIKSIAAYFGDYYSLSLTLACVTGVIIVIKHSLIKNKFSEILRFSFILSIFLILTVIFEKKFYAYHFLRSYLPLSLIAGVGLLFFYKHIKSIKINNILTKLLLVSLLLFTIVFSPLSRWIGFLPVSYNYFFNSSKYDEYYTRDYGSTILRKHQKIIAEKIKKDGLSEKDKVLIISTISHEINYHLGLNNYGRIALSCFYLSNAKIPEWKKIFFDDMKKSKWIIAQINDGNRWVMGYDYPGWFNFKKDTLLYGYLNENFIQTDSIGPFLIFKRMKYH